MRINTINQDPKLFTSKYCTVNIRTTFNLSINILLCTLYQKKAPSKGCRSFSRSVPTEKIFLFTL